MSSVMLLHDSIADQFISTMKQYRLIASSDTDAAYRGLFTSQSADRIRGLIDDAVSKGATRTIGSDDPASGSPTNNVLQPTVLDNTPESARIVTEEIFGPAVAVVRFKEEKDAVRIANDREYGLSAAVFSKDVARAYTIARQIEVRFAVFDSALALTNLSSLARYILMALLFTTLLPCLMVDERRVGGAGSMVSEACFLS